MCRETSTPFQQKVTHLKSNLDGMALNWFRAKFDGIAVIADIDEVYEGLIAQFGAARPALKYLKQIQNLRQDDDEPVQDYYCQMILLLKRANIPLNSRTAIDYVITGLNENLGRRVYGSADKYEDCDELFAKLKVLDEASTATKRSDDELITMARNDSRETWTPRPTENWRRPGTSRDYKSDPQPHQRNQRAEALRPDQPRDNFKRPLTPPPRRVRWQGDDRSRCWTCGASGHWSYECPSGQAADQRSSQGNEERGSASQTSGPSVPPRYRPNSSASRDNRHSSTSN